MKRYILLISLTFLSVLMNAQGNQEQRERRENQLKNLKIAFITQQIDLTSDEAEQFWPIYNRHHNEIFRLKRKEMDALRSGIKEDSDMELLTDAEAAVLLENFLSIDAKIIEEQRAMYTSLATVLSPKKLLKLHKAENEFNRRVLRELQKDRQKRP